ncbi:MAG: hypothetical protein R2702_16460 [Acidimicrobiales bacterium]
MRPPDRIWVPAVAALLLALAYAGALLVRADGDASLLVHAAPPWTSAELARPSLTVQPAEDGFDGQFFYRGAAAPLSTAERAEGVELDLPALRTSRIGYSALAWAASAGDPDRAPWSLLVVNVLAAGAIGAAAGALAQHLGRHAAWGVALVLWPGFAYALSLDTAELVASAFAVAGLVAVERRRWAPAALLLAAAALTRETALVYPAALALAGLIDGRREPGGGARRPLAVGLAAVAAFLAWQLVIWRRFGELAIGSSGGSNNLGAPLVGLATELGRSLPPSGGDEAYRLLCIVGLLALLASAAASWRRSAAPLQVRIAWVPAAALVLVLNDYQWSGATAFLRGATEAGLLSTLIVLGAPERRLRLGLGGALGAGWALSAAAQLSKL